MDLEYTSEQLALRKELREYFAALLTPEVREAIGGANEDRPAAREVIRQMGKDGILGLGWPKEYGGQGRPPADQFILFDEVNRIQAPFPFVTINTVGPTLMTFGTPEQKAKFLPGILAGEIHFAIGYSEPDAGTDLASLKTRAVQRDGEWVINGSKVFTSGAGQADYIWLACRTDPDVAKHKGISIIIVPTDQPGFEATPIQTSGLVWTNASYYSDARAPLDAVVGEVNAGWRIINSQLGHERAGLGAMGGRTEQLYEDVRDWALATTVADGDRAIDVPEVRRGLAHAHARLSAMRLLNWKISLLPEGVSPSPSSASVAKVFGSEMHNTVTHDLMGLLGPWATRRMGTPGAPLDGRLEALTRGAYVNTFGGGTNEVLRDMIATMGLGLPRKPRGQ